MVVTTEDVVSKSDSLHGCGHYGEYISGLKLDQLLHARHLSTSNKSIYQSGVFVWQMMLLNILY